MNTKLTLRLDDQLILKAKRYSDRSGKSVSQLVADYFSLIDADEEIPGDGDLPSCPFADRRVQGCDDDRG